jgi:Pseudouridylate synthases, 23S RNA-specific
MENTPGFAEANTWILYSDQDLLVVNKPAGLLSIPDGYHPEFPHLAQALTPLVGKLWIVHRLDKETSGVMLLARSAEAHRVLNQAFRERALHKLYHCLSAPPPPGTRRMWTCPYGLTRTARTAPAWIWKTANPPEH